MPQEPSAFEFPEQAPIQPFDLYAQKSAHANLLTEPRISVLMTNELLETSLFQKLSIYFCMSLNNVNFGLEHMCKPGLLFYSSGS